MTNDALAVEKRHDDEEFENHSILGTFEEPRACGGEKGRCRQLHSCGLRPDEVLQILILLQQMLNWDHERETS